MKVNPTAKVTMDIDLATIGLRFTILGTTWSTKPIIAMFNKKVVKASNNYVMLILN